MTEMVVVQGYDRREAGIPTLVLATGFQPLQMALRERLPF